MKIAATQCDGAEDCLHFLGPVGMALLALAAGIVWNAQIGLLEQLFE